MEYFWFEHEVIGKFADITSFNHFIVNSVDSRLLFVDEVGEHVLYITPFYLLCHFMTILDIKDNFFDWNGAFDLRVFYSRLVNKMDV